MIDDVPPPPPADPYGDVPSVGELAANGHHPEESASEKRARELAEMLLDTDGLRAIPPPEPIVSDYLYRDSLAWLHGKPGHGKSFVAVDLACSVGTGTDWHGHPVTQGRVLYLIAEGAAGLSRRIDAWQLAHGTAVHNVLFLPVPVQLLQTIDLAAFVQLAAELSPDLLIIDTQARTTVGGDENSGKDMGAFVDSLEQLRNACSACILPVHHEPRAGENLRGHTSLEGAATTILRVEKDGKLVTITNTKQKDAPERPPMTLALAAVGDSAILSHEAVGLAGLTTESELALLAVLRDSFGTRGATKTELREASELAKSTYYRTINALISKGLVVESKHGNSTVYSLAADNRQTEIPTSPTESHP